MAIARALATRPEVIFCDEPTGALDSRTAAEVLTLLRAVVDEHGLTVVMVTHDPVAASYADRVLVLADGRIVADLPQLGAARIAEHLASLDRRARPMTGLAARLLRHRAGPAAATLLALVAGVLILVAMGTLVESGLRFRPEPRLWAAADVVVANRTVSHTVREFDGDTTTSTVGAARGRHGGRGRWWTGSAGCRASRPSPATTGC